MEWELKGTAVVLQLDLLDFVEHPKIHKLLIKALSEKERDNIRRHKSYVDREKNKMKQERIDMFNLEQSYVAKLEQEMSKSQYHYETVKTIKFLLNTMTDTKLDDLKSFIEKRGY